MKPYSNNILLIISSFVMLSVLMLIQEQGMANLLEELRIEKYDDPSDDQNKDQPTKEQEREEDSEKKDKEESEEKREKESKTKILNSREESAYTFKEVLFEGVLFYFGSNKQLIVKYKGVPIYILLEQFKIDC